MMFPLLPVSKRFSVSPAMILVAVMVTTATSGLGQKSADGTFSPEIAGATLQQCQNGPELSPTACTGSAWFAGDASNANSYWHEGQFNSYRILFSDLPAGANTVILGFDYQNSGRIAFDYLGTYNQTNAGSNPCSGVTGCSGWPTSTSPTPTEPTLASQNPPITQIPGVFTFFGATINGTPTYVACPGGNPAQRCVQINFTVSAGIPNPVLAFGAHFAWRGEWGPNQTAADLVGQPYHTRLVSLNGVSNLQDFSMNANGVFGPGSLRIVKAVTTADLGTSSTTAFFFNATAQFGTTNFSLVDDDGGPGVDNRLGAPISVEDGVGNVITFTENTALFPAGQNWSYNFTNCVESVSTAGTVNIANGKTVVIQEGEVVVCTVNNTQLAPSAAPVSVSGRTVDSFGRGIGGVRVSVANLTTGSVSYAITNPFGYYTVNDLAAGDFYVISVAHKRYVFADDTRTLTLHDDFTGLDFIANP